MPTLILASTYTINPNTPASNTIASTNTDANLLLMIRFDADYTWQNSLNVPSKNAINNSVDHHHANCITKTEAIAWHWTAVEIGPLRTNTLLFQPRQIIATDTKCSRGK